MMEISQSSKKMVEMSGQRMDRYGGIFRVYADDDDDDEDDFSTLAENHFCRCVDSRRAEIGDD